MFLHIPGNASNLLEEMNKAQSSVEGTPSSDLLKFIGHIELADPEAEDNEDQTNQSWGHLQFTSGGLTCLTVLVSWASVGNINTAFWLLAAAVKTAKVA